MTRIYVAGPMSSIAEHNFPAFEDARTRLRAAGYDVVCPAELGQVDGWTWAQYLKRDLAALVTCDGVAVLDGWTRSPGAILEVYVADALDMETRHVDEWIYDL